MKRILTFAALLSLGAVVSVWFFFSHAPREGRADAAAAQAKPGAVEPPAPSPAGLSAAPARRAEKHVDRSRVVNPTRSHWDQIQVIINPHGNFAERTRAAARLRGPLSEADWTVLKKFLAEPDALDASQLGQVIKNQVMDALCAIKPAPAGLGEVLIGIYRDRSQDEVVRDYAVQHLGAHYEQLRGQAAEEAALQKVEQVLWSAAQETQDSVGGTALLGLERLWAEYGAIDKETLGAKAQSLAEDPQAGELTHISALQVCAKLDRAEALNAALSLARNGESIAVRLSALGALGRLGGPEQVEFLNQVLSGQEQRLKTAARAALQQISERSRAGAGLR